MPPFPKKLHIIFRLPKVLHLHDNIGQENGGGIEVYLKELMALLPNHYWIGIRFSFPFLHLSEFQKEWNQKVILNKFSKILYQFVQNRGIKIIHLHGVFHLEILKRLPNKIPIIRSFHDLRFTCPGYGKYWYSTDQTCQSACGFSCYYLAFKEKCGSRNPWIISQNLRRIRLERKLMLNRYSKIIVMSGFVKYELQKLGIPDSKIIIVRYFSRFRPVYPFKTKDPPYKILWVGRISKTKGISYFLELAKSVQNKFPNRFSFEIIGDGIDRKTLDFSNVVYHGWQSKAQLLGHFRESFLLVFTSIYPEAFGLVGIEALSQGVPVLAFDVGGVKDWLKNGVNGFLFNKKNISSMERTVFYLSENPEKYIELCQSIFEKQRNKNSLTTHLNQLKYVYIQLITD
jgi:glycosyltransferase involved in cell wall biosynthesis